MLQQCLAQAHPGTLMGWIRLAGEIEGRMQILHLVDARDAAEKVSSRPVKKSDSRKSGKTREPSTSSYDEKKMWREKGLCLGCGGKGHFLAECPSKSRPASGGAAKPKAPTGGARKKPDRGTKRSAKVLVAAGTKSSDTSSVSGSESDSTETKEPAGNGDDLL